MHRFVTFFFVFFLGIGEVIVFGHCHSIDTHKTIHTLTPAQPATLVDYMIAVGWFISLVIPIHILRFYYLHRKPTKCHHLSDGSYTSIPTVITSKSGRLCTTTISKCKLCGCKLFHVKGYVDANPSHIITLEYH